MTKLIQIAGQMIRESNDFFIDVAAGGYTDLFSLNKYGEAPNGIQITLTDIWSRADATPTQQIWLAPTAARVHALVSSSAADTDFSVRVYGLTSWSTAETSELVALNGTTPVNTVNSYVIIHRMKMIPTAAKTTNAGVITATAATDNTVTASILAGDGQTEMAIYGVPSTQTAYLYVWSASMNKAVGAATGVNFQMRVNENPNVQTTGFLRKSDFSLLSTGTSSRERHYSPPLKYAGPCIIKIQAYSTAADTDGNSSFDLILVNN